MPCLLSFLETHVDTQVHPDLLMWNMNDDYDVYLAIKIPIAQASLQDFAVCGHSAHMTLSYKLRIHYEDTTQAWTRWWRLKNQIQLQLVHRKITFLLCSSGRSFGISPQCELHTVAMMCRAVFELDPCMEELAAPPCFHIAWAQL